ncbi:MAG: MFS transporter, partial [Deferribacteraceae bacterium]|nr:MFS transporter [Deferribacteraceae bacterium]
MDKDIERALPWVVSVALFMKMLDTTIMNTSLPSIAVDFNESPLEMQSVVVSYLLTLALFMPISGWIADRFGVRNVFIFANIVFMIGSLLSAISGSVTELVLARIVQGFGGAFLAPVGRLAIIKVFPRSRLTEMLSFISIPALMGPLVGPAVGGFLSQYASWHWIFLINIPAGIFASLAAVKYMPSLKVEGLARFDWTGFALVGFSLICGTLGLKTATGFYIPSIYAMPLVLASFILLIWYVVHAKRVKFPLFDLKVFKIRSFSVGIVGNIFARLASGTMPYMTPLLLQVGLGYSPFYAGLLLIPSAIMSIFGKQLVTYLLKRVSYRLFLCTNTVLIGVFMMLYATVGHDTPLWL